MWENYTWALNKESNKYKEKLYFMALVCISCKFLISIALKVTRQYNENPGLLQ